MLFGTYSYLWGPLSRCPAPHQQIHLSNSQRLSLLTFFVPKSDEQKSQRLLRDNQWEDRCNNICKQPVALMISAQGPCRNKIPNFSHRSSYRCFFNAELRHNPGWVLELKVDTIFCVLESPRTFMLLVSLFLLLMAGSYSGNGTRNLVYWLVLVLSSLGSSKS